MSDYSQVKWPIAKVLIFPLNAVGRKKFNWDDWDPKKEKSEILLRYHRTPAVEADKYCF
jgi:hypothetical protein